MKTKITITIDKKIWKFMTESFTNKSALINALIVKFYTENHTKIEMLNKCSEGKGVW